MLQATNTDNLAKAEVRELFKPIQRVSEKMVNTCTCSKFGPCTMICPTKGFNATNGYKMAISHSEECVLCIQ